MCYFHPPNLSLPQPHNFQWITCDEVDLCQFKLVFLRISLGDHTPLGPEALRTALRMYTSPLQHWAPHSCWVGALFCQNSGELQITYILRNSRAFGNHSCFCQHWFCKPRAHKIKGPGIDSCLFHISLKMCISRGDQTEMDWEAESLEVMKDTGGKVGKTGFEFYSTSY